MQRREFSLGLAALGAFPVGGLRSAGRPGATSPKVGTARWRGLSRTRRVAWGVHAGYRNRPGFGLASGRAFSPCAAPSAVGGVDAVAGGPGPRKLDARGITRLPMWSTTRPSAGRAQAQVGALTVGELCSATVSLERQHRSQRLAGTPRRPGCAHPLPAYAGDPITRLDRNEPTLNEAAIGDVRDTTTPLAMLQTMQKAGAGRITVCPRPARGCSVGSLKPALATSACARGPGLEGGDKTGTAAAVVPPTMWPCFGRCGASGHRGQCW